MSAPLKRSQTRPLSWSAWFAALLAVGLFFVLLLGLNMRRGLNHDEHQFVGSAVLMAREGLRPYVDFAYFHVPGQTLLTAAFFAIFDRFLLTARLISIVSGWLSLALLVWIGVRYAPFVRGWARVGYALAGALTLLASPMFVHTSGRAWNHDLPMLLTLAGLVVFLHAVQPAASNPPPLTRRTAGWFALTGALLGLAAATRLSYAFLAPAFALGLWLWGSDRGWRDRARCVLWLFVGGVVGMAPVWWALLTAPDAFLFGNVIYNLRLNPLYYETVGSASSMTMPTKLVYLAELLIARPANLTLPLLFVVALVPALPYLRGRTTIPLKMVLLLLPFALFSAMSPTPSQIQYYFVLYPLLLLGFFFGVAVWPRRQHLAAAAVGVAAAVSIVATAVSYGEGLAIVLQPNEWYPIKTHQRSQTTARLADHGRILTLAPIHVMEGGAKTYPEFVTGPMAWRVAPFVSAEDRARFGFVDATEMPKLLAQKPPRGILTDFKEDDAELEQVLIDYARQHDFVPTPLVGEGVLWLSGMFDWNDAIRLGGVDLPPTPLAPGDEFVVTLFLMKRAPIEQNLNVLVRLVNAEGRVAARSEGWPYGSATQTWQEGVMWPDGHHLVIDAQTPSGVHRLEVSFYDPETLAPFGDTAVAAYLFVGEESTPQPAQPLATFDQGLDLLAVETSAEPWQGGEQSITLIWRPTRALDAAFTVFVHLIGPEGQLVAQRDQPPLQGFYPSDRWLPGHAFRDVVTLEIPADAPPGAYHLSIGLYDPTTGQRLPLLEDGAVVGDAFQQISLSLR
ncbi:MAG: hypothetical protein KJZ95_01850 [Caldilinea sp.]|nr:hypothetical protein [Caldilinea sp.]